MVDYSHSSSTFSHAITHENRKVKSTASTLPSLNGIRFILAIGVYLFHVSIPRMWNPFSDAEISDSYAFFFSKSGWVGVSFFFILSGFVMTWSARPIDDPIRFYKKRLAKIYPSHVVTLLILMACGAVSFNRPDIWLPNLLLIQAWIPDIDIFFGANTPSWFLSAIIFFYLTFPWLIKLVKRIPVTFLWPTIWICYAGMIISQVVVYELTSSGLPVRGWPVPIGNTQMCLAYTFPLLRLYEFLIGMVTARIIQEGKWIRISITTCVALSILAYMVDLFMPFQFSFNLVTLIPFVLFLGSLVVGDINNQPNFLSSALMQWLGTISFGFYMIHYAILLLLKRTMGTASHDLVHATLLIVLGGIMSILGGWLLYRFVERPASAWLSRR
ncbi:acyltransferase family protein [Dickeya fangzhongdai]